MDELKTMEELETTTELEVYEEPETSGNGIIGKLALIALAVGGGTALLLHKTKDKRKQKRIEKLRKEGYVVIEPEGVVEDVEAEVVEAETDK